MSVPPSRSTRRAKRREFRLRPLGVGELLDEALAIYRSNAKLFLSLILIPAIVFTLANTVLKYALGAWMAPIDPKTQLPAFENMGNFAVVWVCAYPIIFLSWAYQQAVLTGAISACYINRETTARAIRLQLKGLVGRVVGSYLLCALIAAGAGAVFLSPLIIGIASGPDSPMVVFGVFSACCGIPVSFVFLMLFLFVAAAIASENLSATAAISRSVRLVFSDFWRVLGTTIVVGCVSVIISMIADQAIQLPFAIAGLIDPFGFGYVKTTPITVVVRAAVMLLQSAAWTFILPFPIAVTVLLYFDIRVRREGYDVEMLASAMGSSAGPDFVL